MVRPRPLHPCLLSTRLHCALPDQFTIALAALRASILGFAAHLGFGRSLLYGCLYAEAASQPRVPGDARPLRRSPNGHWIPAQAPPQVKPKLAGRWV